MGCLGRFPVSFVAVSVGAGCLTGLPADGGLRPQVQFGGIRAERDRVPRGIKETSKREQGARVVLKQANEKC